MADQERQPLQKAEEKVENKEVQTTEEEKTKVEGEEKKEEKRDEKVQAFFRITLNSAPPSEKEEEKKEDSEENKSGTLEVSLGESLLPFLDEVPKEKLAISLNEPLLPEPEPSLVEETGGSGLQIPLSESIFDMLKGDDQEKEEDKDKVRPAEGDSYIFDQRLGHIIGRPILSLSTRQHNYLEVVINDPDGEIFARIKEFKEVKAQIGFSDGRLEDKFTGVLSWVGRQLPDGTIIKAMDLGSNTDSSSFVDSNANKKISQEEIKEVLDTFGKDFKDLEFGEPVQLKTALNSFPLSGPLLYSLQEVANDPNLFTENKANDNKGGYGGNKPASGLSLQPNPEAFTGTSVNATKSDQQKMQEMKASLRAISSINSIQNEPDSFIKSTLGKTDNKIKDADDLKIDKSGNINFNDSWMSSLVADAAQKGQVVTTNEKGETTVSTVGQGGRDTGIIIDYNENRAVFKYTPRILKRTAFNNRSGYGSISISGWDVRNKSERGATLTVPDNPAGVSIADVPDWGTIKMADPIFEGSVYTWGDATRNGSRVPKSKEHMANIISIAKVIQELTDQTVGKGKKWTITSWYRLHVVKAKNSQHMVGRAVDAYFPGFRELHKKMYSTWMGGLAIDKGFIHIDNRPGGNLDSRWTYS